MTIPARERWRWLAQRLYRVGATVYCFAFGHDWQVHTRVVIPGVVVHDLHCPRCLQTVKWNVDLDGEPPA